jgi:hypothetical protein
MRAIRIASLRPMDTSRPHVPPAGGGGGTRYVAFGVLALIGTAVLGCLVLLLPWWLVAREEDEWGRECCRPTPATSASLMPEPGSSGSGPG